MCVSLLNVCAFVHAVLLGGCTHNVAHMQKCATMHTGTSFSIDVKAHKFLPHMRLNATGRRTFGTARHEWEWIWHACHFLCPKLSLTPPSCTEMLLDPASVPRLSQVHLTPAKPYWWRLSGSQKWCIQSLLEMAGLYLPLLPKFVPTTRHFFQEQLKKKS